jgi:DNA (cytosine-5)-methyltransferase 1
VTGKTFAEFFAGIGLVRLGLEMAGWKAVFANDIDQKKFEMYRDNFADAHGAYVVADVHHLQAAEVPSVTVATASFPCTDLSLAGYRKGLAGTQSGAFWGFARILDQMDGRRPPVVMIENVTGFLTSDGGRDFINAIACLNRLGYSCDAFLLDAVNFVAQSRPRLFVVGVHDVSVTWYRVQVLATRDPRLRSPRLTELMTARTGLRWTVLDIPPPPRREGCLVDIIETVPPDSNRWWSQDRVSYLLAQMSGRHRGVADVLMASPTERYATVYRRVRYGKSMAELRTDGVAGCLRTPRGGSSRQILLVAGMGAVRARFMTPREYARLMGAPQYTINVPDNQAYFGFGDAVCVPVIQWIGQRVLNPLVDGVGLGTGNLVATPG